MRVHKLASAPFVMAYLRNRTLSSSYFNLVNEPKYSRPTNAETSTNNVKRDPSPLFARFVFTRIKPKYTISLLLYWINFFCVSHIIKPMVIINIILTFYTYKHRIHYTRFPLLCVYVVLCCIIICIIYNTLFSSLTVHRLTPKQNLERKSPIFY